MAKISRSAFSFSFVVLCALAYGGTKVNWDRAHEPEYWKELGAQAASKTSELAGNITPLLAYYRDRFFVAHGYMREIMDGMDEAQQRGPKAVAAYYKEAREKFEGNKEAQWALFSVVAMRTAPKGTQFGFGSIRFLEDITSCKAPLCYYGPLVSAVESDLNFRFLADKRYDVTVCFEPAGSAVAIKSGATYLTGEQARRIVVAPTRPEAGTSDGYKGLPSCGELAQK